MSRWHQRSLRRRAEQSQRRAWPADLVFEFADRFRLLGDHAVSVATTG